MITWAKPWPVWGVEGDGGYEGIRGVVANIMKEVIKVEYLAIKMAIMRTKEIGRAVVIYVEEDLNQFNCTELRFQAISLISKGKSNIVIDMSGAKYIDSTGMSVITFLSDLLLKRHDRKLKLVDLQPNPRAMIKAIQLDEVFEIYDSLDQAIEI